MHRRAQQEADITRETLELELAQQRAQARSMEEELAHVRAELAAASVARMADRALLETSLSSTRAELDKKHTELMEVVFRVQRSWERQVVAERDLHHCTEQVLRLWEQLASSSAMGPSGTPSLPQSQ